MPCHVTWSFAWPLLCMTVSCQKKSKPAATPWSTFLLVMLGSVLLLLSRSQGALKWAQCGWSARQMHHTDVVNEIQTCLTNNVWNCRNEWTAKCCLLMDHRSHQTMSKYQFTGPTLLITSDVMADSQKIQKTIWSFFTEQTFFAIYTWHFANISEQGLNQRSFLVCQFELNLFGDQANLWGWGHWHVDLIYCSSFFQHLFQHISSAKSQIKHTRSILELCMLSK